MKQLINRPEDVVLESIQGLTSTIPFLAHLDGFPSIKVVYNTKHDGDKHVSIISGGGSGHEPAFASYVGTGMLAAAIAGDVFAAPPEEAVLAAIRQVTGKAGALIIFNNYTGDRLCFGAAAERAKAEGYNVAISVIADDCALKHKTSLGRRGLAGSVLALKAAGAAAATGQSLSQCKAVADRVAASIGTMGCTLTVCTLPGEETDTTDGDSSSPHKGKRVLADDEVEMGLGLHGEPGAYKQKIKPVDGLAYELVSRIAGEADSYLPVPHGTPVVVLVNNLGGATCLEMGVIAHAAAKAVGRELGAHIQRMYVGAFMTSLDMRGFSITIMKVVDDDSKVASSMLLELLDAPTDAPAWPKSSIVGPFDPENKATSLPNGPPSTTSGTFGTSSTTPMSASIISNTEYDTTLLSKYINAACTALIHNAGYLNELDATVGDGDCGSTLEKGAGAVMAALTQNALPLNDPSATAMEVAALLGRTMGGTSGGILKIFFTALAADLRTATISDDSNNDSEGVSRLGRAMRAGVHAVSTYGGARLGDRTLLDALHPAVEAFISSSSSSGQWLKDASDAASEGAEATKMMVPGAGRSSYVPLDVVKGVVDPGAKAVAIVFEAMARCSS